MIVLGSACGLIHPACYAYMGTFIPLPFAFSFYTYSVRWRTDTAGSLAEAVEEMPAGYADKMAPVIDNIPVLVIMLLLTVPVAILAIRLAEKVMKKRPRR